MNLRLILATALLLFVLFSNLMAQVVDPPFLKPNSPWVDSVLNSLTIDEKIAQLIMIPANSSWNLKKKVQVMEDIRKYKVGGICFFEGDAKSQAEDLNYYQSKSKVPLIIAMDAEWGAGMRLSDVHKFPYSMTLGALQTSDMVYRMGVEVALQLKKVGVHINLAPVVDVNNNPLNPVINYRSFGENPSKVASFAAAYMKGMQDNGILACAKHFPGHGNTDIDSHFNLPIINMNRNQLEANELYPYRKLFPQGLGCVMVGHLCVPALDPTPHLPSTLSKLIVTDLLKTEMGFKGLIITDALEMRGVAEPDSAGLVELKALMAGNDIITIVSDIQKTIDAVKDGIKKGKITLADIDAKCKKVLAAKKWMGLDKISRLKSTAIAQEMNSNQALYLHKTLIEQSITVLQNAQIPINQNLKIATLSINTDSSTVFEKYFEGQPNVKHFVCRRFLSEKEAMKLIDELQKYDLVIAGLHNISLKQANNYGLNAEMIHFVDELAGLKSKVVLSVFGNPYSLSLFKSIKKFGSLLVTYQENTESLNACAKVVLGKLPANAKLPVSVGSYFKEGDGLDLATISTNSLSKIHPKYEFRGVWVATVANIDWPSSKTLTTEQQKSEIIELLDMHKKNGMNAIIMQVRPTSDALYNSKIEPWSKWLTGTQGKAPDPIYDPLEFYIDECHKRGMEFHAWFNPYRVFNDLKDKAAANHISVTHPELMLKYGNLMIFDPGYPKTREFVANVIMDVLRRYDLDAIHFDDYFYPYRIKGLEFPDTLSFKTQNRGFPIARKDDWRRDNVDIIIKMLHDSIQAVKPYVKFGISPFSVWRNNSADASGSLTRAGQTNYDDLFADILKWSRLGWIDYVLPQLYFSMGYKVADYKILADWWAQNAFGKGLYIGQAPYRLDANAKDSAFRSSSEIMKQIRYNRNLPEIQGSAYFSSKSFKNNPMGLNDSLQTSVYKYSALIPPMNWIDSVPPAVPGEYRWEKSSKGIKLKWNKTPYIFETDRQAYFVIYKFMGTKKGDLNDPASIVRITRENEFEIEMKKSIFGKKYIYVITSLDRLYNESQPSKPIILKLK